MLHTAQIKLEIYERQAVKLEDIKEEFEDKDQTEQDEGIFQSTSLDMSAALGSTNLL